jgi:TRAP-type C4-dicarboxylate transport system substrate-binding protein
MSLLSGRHNVFSGVLLALLLVGVQANAAVFKIATISPDGSSWMKSMRAAADDIEKQTEGRVKFKFYPGGVMGSDEAVLRKIRIGQLQGGAMPGGALISFYPDAQVYNLPLKFRSFAEVDYVRARMDQKIVDGLEEGGFVTFGLGEGGFAYILSKDAISTMEDLRSHKVWIPNNDAGALLAIKTFGVSPIPLNLSDVLAGLQTGLVDTVASSPIGTIALQWHTQVSHMSDLPVMYFYALLAIDKKPFGKLSTADQAAVRKTMTAAFKQIDKQNRVDNVAAYDALLKQGISQVEMSASQREPWYAAASEAEKNMVDQGVISSAILRELDGYLQEVRAQTGATP